MLSILILLIKIYYVLLFLLSSDSISSCDHIDILALILSCFFGKHKVLKLLLISKLSSLSLDK